MIDKEFFELEEHFNKKKILPWQDRATLPERFNAIVDHLFKQEIRLRQLEGLFKEEFLERK